MQKLTYFGTHISPNQVVSKQGYLLCMNVPICRTGYQSYLGSELEGHPGYDPEWGLSTNERYDVYRSLEAVTNPATVSSFEGATVVDEHPDSMRYPGSLVTCENDTELNRGHAQNVRVGPVLDSGETPLLADLHVKAFDLITKIDGGVRDVSCGYTFTLRRAPDGTLEMTNIRGNHVAVVPKGRAGDEVAIVDSEPTKTKKEKRPMKNLKDWILGTGLIAAASAKDADPEEIAALAKEVVKDGEEPEEKPTPKKKEKDEPEAIEDADEHPKGCRCDECKPMSAKDKAAKDRKAAKDAEEKEAEAAKDAPDVEDLDDMDTDAKAGVIGDEDIEELDDTGKTAIKGVMDSSRHLIKVLKPLMGSGTLPRAAVDAYNAHIRALNTSKGNPYAALVQVQAPILALDSQPKNTINPRSFFEGVTYAEGQRKYNEYLAAQGGR